MNTFDIIIFEKKGLRNRMPILVFISLLLNKFKKAKNKIGVIAAKAPPYIGSFGKRANARLIIIEINL